MFEEVKFIFQSSKKTTTIEYFFSMEHGLLAAERPLFWIFRGWKVRYFLSQNVDGNMIFVDYGKVLVLNFSGMGNTVFFWDKKLMKRLFLLITEMFLFWTFRGWKIRSFLREKVDRKVIFSGYWKILVLGYRKVFVLSFSVMGNTVSFLAKKFM